MPGRSKKEIYLPYRYRSKLSSERKDKETIISPVFLKREKTVNKKPRLFTDRKRGRGEKSKKKSSTSLYYQEILLKNLGDSKRCSCASCDLQRSVWEHKEGHRLGTAQYTHAAQAEHSTRKCITPGQRDELKDAASAGVEDY